MYSQCRIQYTTEVENAECDIVYRQAVFSGKKELFCCLFPKDMKVHR